MYPTIGSPLFIAALLLFIVRVLYLVRIPACLHYHSCLWLFVFLCNLKSLFSVDGNICIAVLPIIDYLPLPWRLLCRLVFFFALSTSRTVVPISRSLFLIIHHLPARLFRTCCTTMPSIPYHHLFYFAAQLCRLIILLSVLVFFTVFKRSNNEV